MTLRVVPKSSAQFGTVKHHGEAHILACACCSERRERERAES